MKMKEDNKTPLNGVIPAYVNSTELTKMTFNAVITVDLQGRITFWNPAAEELYGLKARQVLGKTITDLFKPMLVLGSQQTQILEQEKLDGGAVATGQYKLRLDNGSFIWVEYRSRAILTEEGEICGYLVIHHDITGHKIMEADMALVAKMPAENPNPVMRFTPDGEVIYANDASQPLLDFWKRQNQQDLPEKLLSEIRKAFDSNMKKEVEVEYNFRTLFCTLAPIRESGCVNFYGTDITKRKRAEKALRLARTRAEQSKERMVRLQKVTAALSEAVTPADVARVVIEQGVPTSNAKTGSIMTLSEDGQSLEIISTSSSENVARAFQSFPASSNVPAAEALRSGQPVWIKSRHDYKERYPHLVEQIKEWGMQAAVAVPMIVNNRRFGVLTFSFTHAQDFSPDDQDFILTLAQQAAQALDRANLFQMVTHTLSELQLTYDQSPIGMIQLDADLRYIRINETLARYNGIPASDHIGRTIHEIVPHLAPQVEEGFRKVIETGIPVLNVEVVGETSADLGMPHTWLESWFPLRDASNRVQGLNIVVQDISQRKRDEQALREYARQQSALFALADQLHRRNTMKGIFESALDAILDALQCDRASILLFDAGGVMRFVAWRGISDDYRKATDGHSPWKPDEKNAQPIAYDDIQTADLGDELKAVIAEEGIGSLAFIPLVYEDKLIGKFMVYFNAPHTFSDNDLELSLAIARQVAFGIERKRIEENLKNERELLERLFETMPVMVSLYVPNTPAPRVNPHFEKLTGWKNGELSVVDMLHALYPDPEYLTEVLETMSKSGPNEWVEVRVATRDGGTLESLWANISMFDEQQQLVTGIALGIDISERKRAEQELRASESLYRAIARSIPGGGIYVVDKDFRYIVAEGPVTEAFGLTREMLEGHTVAEVFSPTQVANMEARLKKNFAGETVNYETEHKGRIYWTHHAPLLDGQERVLILTLDITERKQMEEALRESQERFARFMHHLPGLAWIKDTQGRYVFANAAAEKAFGVGQKELYGRTDNQIFAPEVASQFWENDRQVLAQGKALQFTETLEQDDGILHYSLVSKFPIPGPDGATALIGGTALDITERKQMEDSLRESKEQLQEFNETLERKVQAQTTEIRSLASDLTKAEQRERNRVSHILHDDLQQRLYAAKIHAASLRDELQEGMGAPIYEELTAITTQLNGAVTLARNLSIELSPPILQGEGLSQAVEWLASHMKESYGLHIEVQTKDAFAIPDEDVQVLLFNCVRELLFNIVKHAGTDQASVHLDQVNSHLQIEVRDHGKGFDLSKMPGYGDHKINREEKGRKGSFGIPTIRHQLSLFGGQLDIRSKPGDGTHVKILMPIENGNGQ